MTSLDRLPATLDLRLKPADQSITFTATGQNLSGTWVVKVRRTVADTNVLLTPTMDVTQAASGIVKLGFTETSLLGLITAGASTFTGVWEAQLDSVPWFAGAFVVQQKGSR